MIYFEDELDSLPVLSMQNFSYSRINTFNTCQLRYFYSYIIKVPQVFGNAALLGNIIHKALEVSIEDGYEIDSSELHSNYRAALTEYDPNRQIPNSMVLSGTEMLNEFLMMNPGKQRVHSKEMEFSLIIGRGRFNGFIDKVEVEDKRVTITDYKCVTDHTEFSRLDGSIVKAIDLSVGDTVLGWSEGGIHPTKVVNIADNGKQHCLVITTHGGRHLSVTNNHPVMTERGWVLAEDLKSDDRIVVGLNLAHTYLSYGEPERELTLPDAALLAEFMLEGPFESYLLFQDDLMITGVDQWIEIIKETFKGRFHLKCLNSTIATDIQRILTYLGVNSSKYMDTMSWYVTINNSSKLDFYELIINNKRPNKLMAHDKVKSIFPRGRAQTWAITVDENHTHITDGLVTHNSGKVEVALKNTPTDLQLRIYSLVARKMWPSKEVYAELYYLKSNKRKGHLFTEDDLDVAEAVVVDSVNQILSTEDFKPTANENSCKWCSYAKDGTCAVGRQRLRKKGVLQTDY